MIRWTTIGTMVRWRQTGATQYAALGTSWPYAAAHRPHTAAPTNGGYPCWPRDCRSRCDSGTVRQPPERFTKHWTATPWISIEPLDHTSISCGAHAADTLAGSLRAPHVGAPAEAPIATDPGAHSRNCTNGFDHFFSRPYPRRPRRRRPIRQGRRRRNARVGEATALRPVGPTRCLRRFRFPQRSRRVRP